jgi:hypothetical protein
MKFRIATAVLALGSAAFGSSQKPQVTVRFHSEANPNDGASFAMPAKLQYQQRDVYLNRVPSLSERQIKKIYPFPADDGTYGCVFQFDQQGRIRLETMSSEQQHTALVLFVGTKQGQHQVVDMLIDRPVTSGTFTVPRGLTQLEVAVMKTQFPVMGEEKVKKEKKKKSELENDEVTDWRIDRTRDKRPENPATPAAPVAAVPNTPPPPKTAPVPRQKLRELDLPRIAD